MIGNIVLDESFENIRSGANAIVISLPKQKHVSYLLRFSSPDGKLSGNTQSLINSTSFLLDLNSFRKILSTIKSGRSIEDNISSQFDERTEESSAVQYFQVCFLLG